MSKTEQFDVDLDSKDLARIDALIPSYSTPSHKTTRATMVRLLIDAGLQAFESKEASIQLSGLRGLRAKR